MSDTQLTEVIGRNLLVNELLAADLEVALPLRDRGVDLIAYAEIAEQVDSFKARPIQLKASSVAGFSIHKKYARISDLLIAFVWYLREPRDCVIYARSYADSIRVATDLGWTKTDSWTKKGAYANTRPGKRIVEMLTPHRMDADRWRKLVLGED